MYVWTPKSQIAQAQHSTVKNVSRRDNAFHNQGDFITVIILNGNYQLIYK